MCLFLNINYNIAILSLIVLTYNIPLTVFIVLVLMKEIDPNIKWPWHSVFYEYD